MISSNTPLAGAPLADLAGALDCLRWAVDQGRPAPTERHALHDHYERTLDDLDAALRELAGHLQAAWRTPGRAGAVAAGAQRAYGRLLALALERALGFEQFAALDELAHEQPALWGPWVAGVLDALEPLREALPGPLEALAAAVERPGEPAGLSVTTFAVSMGAPAPGGRPLAADEA